MMSGNRQGEPQRSVRPSTPEDAPQIIALMREAGLHPPLDPGDLFWKYWQKREDWPGPRSYVLTEGGELLAHLGLVPTGYRLESVTLKIGSVVDWAARPHAAGAGARLMKHVGSLTDALLAIQPSSVAGKVMGLMGYQARGFVTGYVRPLRPLRLLHGRPSPGWRLPARVARSILWTLTAPRPTACGWQTLRIGAEQIDRIAGVLPESREGLAVLERTPQQLRYMLDCPSARMDLYVCEGHSRGYFILAFFPTQVRLVDCWTESLDPSDWCALIQCAVTQVRRVHGVAELVAWGSDPLLAQSLTDCGFHARFTAPIYLRARSESRIAQRTPRVQMLDSDLAYLQGPGRALWA
jgi:Acetyltransferase (GNAT) domain